MESLNACLSFYVYFYFSTSFRPFYRPSIDSTCTFCYIGANNTPRGDCICTNWTRAFGRFLAGLRKEKGLTQRQLAERLFVLRQSCQQMGARSEPADTALLIPLAEALDVTVTELLLCRRCPAAEPIAPDTVEHAVKAAIRYPDSIHTSKRAWQQRPRGIVWFAAALAAGAAGVYANFRLGNPHAETVQLLAIMAAVFGAYFCCSCRSACRTSTTRTSWAFLGLHLAYQRPRRGPSTRKLAPHREGAAGLVLPGPGATSSGQSRVGWLFPAFGPASCISCCFGQPVRPALHRRRP